jgi:hypothetical protein
VQQERLRKMDACCFGAAKDLSLSSAPCSCAVKLPVSIS